MCNKCGGDTFDSCTECTMEFCEGCKQLPHSHEECELFKLRHTEESNV